MAEAIAKAGATSNGVRGKAKRDSKVAASSAASRPHANGHSKGAASGRRGASAGPADAVRAPGAKSARAGSERAALASARTVSTPRKAAARSAPVKAAEVPIWEWPMERVWTEYKSAPTEPLRNHLVENYLPLVRSTAERLHQRLPGEVEVDDLMQAGLFGLMDAIENFDLGRGVKFETFSATRIRGAIFDELRSMDWVPRLVRARTAKVERARKSLEMEFGRKPTDAELCERLDVDLGEFQKLSKDSRPVGVVSLNRKWFDTDSSRDVREIDVIRDHRQDNPLDEVQRKDLRYLITKGLSRAERLIVILYYYEEMTMKEIGMTLDLSESRVSQMHSSILARLKAQMQHREKDI